MKKKLLFFLKKYILVYRFIPYFCNISLIYINVFFFFNKKCTKILKENKEIQLNQIKNIDFVPITFSNKNFYDISYYLNSKYEKYPLTFFYNSIFKPKRKKVTSKKKKIILNSVDLCSFSFHKKWLKSLLKEKFIIKFCSNNPDYLIYNVFGSEHLNEKYKNSVKIAYFTENKIPDINEVDYAIGHYHINYLDRYFKYNIFMLYWIKKVEISRKKFLNGPKRFKFCAAMISNNQTTDGFRLKFIDELNKYKKVDFGGKTLNNIGRFINDKIEFLREYKFSIAMENSNGDGYISEKIIHAFFAGTIPIYYGDYMVDEYINPKTYILIKGEKDIKKKIEYIKEIDNNDELYKNMLREKVLLDNNIIIDTNKELKEFLFNIFQQKKSKAYRR